MLLRRGCPAQWHVLGPAKPDPSAGHDEPRDKAPFHWLLFESDSGEAATRPSPRTTAPSRSSFEARAVIGPRFARTRWLAPPATTAKPLRRDAGSLAGST